VGDERSSLADVGVGDPWSGRVVLITGAAGLLGGAVTRQLLAVGAEVVGLDIAWDGPREALRSPAVRRVDGDVRDTSVLAGLVGDLAVDTVIHLAAQALVGAAVRDPAETFSHNIAGSWSVLEVCRATPTVTATVVASSDKAYGDWSGRPYREDMALRARNPYDVSKAATDLLAQSYAATYQLPVGITRCGNLYGGGDLHWSRVVPGTIRSILEGERPVVRSDGTPVRDYLYVDDAADGILRLASAVRDRTHAAGEAFNFAGRDRLAVIDVVQQILAAMGSDLEPDVQAMELPEIPHQRVATTKARQTLGWRPKERFDQGIEETIAWYRTYLAHVT
jgi:CDP-glucose 4,6-dehydratase